MDSSWRSHLVCGPRVGKGRRTSSHSSNGSHLQMLANEHKDKDAANVTLEVHMSSCSTYRAYLCNMLLSHTRVRRQISGAWPDSLILSLSLTKTGTESLDSVGCRKSGLTPPTI
jgi:hypothetical protein